MIICKYSNSQIINIFNRILLFSLFIFFSCSSNELRQQLNLQEMEIQIEKNSFPKTTSVLVSQRGKMVYEDGCSYEISDLTDDGQINHLDIISLVSMILNF